MTGFSAEWLSLREAADTRARDAHLTMHIAQAAHRHLQPRFIDLACGTGSNVRYLAPRIGGEQQWLLVDSDGGLLEKARAIAENVNAPGPPWTSDPTRPDRATCRIDTRHLNLSTHLHALDFTPNTIVTASALLDLVCDRWLVQLVDHCRAGGCAALFALSYDGRIALTPSDADDEWIRQLVNLHQLGDKGFGPALGPRAWERTCELLREAGYQVHTARSDWDLQPAERLLQESLIEGWARAAMELAPNDADRCRLWLARRLTHVANGISQATVGHIDVLALPAD